MSDERWLRLGVQMAEVEAWYGCVLDAATANEKRRFLIELARAGESLAFQAYAVAGEGAGEGKGRSGGRPATRRRAPSTRIQRRAARARRAADWIIARSAGRPA